MIVIPHSPVVLLATQAQIQAQMIQIPLGNHQKLAMMMKNGLYIQTYKKNKDYSELIH